MAYHNRKFIELKNYIKKTRGDALSFSDIKFLFVVFIVRFVWKMKCEMNTNSALASMLLDYYYESISL